MPTSSQTLLCRYHYDPLDRLAATASLGEPDALRFYQKNRLATEIQGAVRRSIIQHEDLLLAQQQRGDSAVETTLLATDQQRSVLHLLDNSDMHSRAYNPYGHLPADSGLTSLLGFNGEHCDPVTGHYLLGNGYRAYNPVLMRFNSPDSLSPFGEGGINAYAYCAGDPVNLVDSSGHSPFRIFPRPSFYRSAYLARIMPKRKLEKGNYVSGGGQTKIAFVARDNGATLLQSAVLEKPILTAASASASASGSTAVPLGLDGVKSASQASSHRRMLSAKTPEDLAKALKSENDVDRLYIKRKVKAGYLSSYVGLEADDRLSVLDELIKKAERLSVRLTAQSHNATNYKPTRTLAAAEKYASLALKARDFRGAIIARINIRSS